MRAAKVNGFTGRRCLGTIKAGRKLVLGCGGRSGRPVHAPANEGWPGFAANYARFGLTAAHGTRVTLAIRGTSYFIG